MMEPKSDKAKNYSDWYKHAGSEYRVEYIEGLKSHERSNYTQKHVKPALQDKGEAGLIELIRDSPRIKACYRKESEGMRVLLVVSFPSKMKICAMCASGILAC